MMSKFQSNALWPADVYKGMYGDNISTDTHPSQVHAQAVCDALMREGFGGERKHFPLAVWVSDVQQPPKLPYGALLAQLTAEREARQREEALNVLQGEAIIALQNKLELAESRIKASQEQDNRRDEPCREDDGCPTEKAVLQRDWRVLQRENAELTRKLAEQQASTFQFREAAQALFDEVDPTNVMSGCECEPEVGYTCAGCQFTNKEEVRNFRKALFKLNPNSEELAKLIEEAKRQAAPEGWKLVPIEPTEAMLDAFQDSKETTYNRCDMGRDGANYRNGIAYKAMLSAAPQPEKD